VAELIAKLKKAGARVKYHACGNTKALLPLLAQLGADILNLDSLLDLAQIKEKMGHKVCIKGNLDPVRILLNGTPVSITEAVRECIQIGGQDGGFILSPGCVFTLDTTTENFEAFVQAAKTYGRYPLVA
jgi:uroporphyrinogen decarboxylase